MMIKYSCNNSDCDNCIEKYFKTSKDIVPYIDCGQCSIGKLERQLGAPSTKSTQIIDNGLMSRKVEISSHVLEKERNKGNR